MMGEGSVLPRNVDDGVPWRRRARKAGRRRGPSPRTSTRSATLS